MTDAMHTEWIGDLDSDSAGRLGLWQVCQRDETSDNCEKKLTDFLSIPSIPFQVKIRWLFSPDSRHTIFRMTAFSTYTFTFFSYASIRLYVNHDVYYNYIFLLFCFIFMFMASCIASTMSTTTITIKNNRMAF